MCNIEICGNENFGILTAVFKKVATFNIDFASRDGNRTQQNAFRSCDSNFERKTTYKYTVYKVVHS